MHSLIAVDGKHGTFSSDVWVSSAALASTHRNVAVNYKQLLSCYVKLATKLIWFPVDYSESLVIWVKN